MIIQQRTTCEHDCLDDIFITFKTCEKGTTISKITLHYFEKFFDFQKKLRRATYDVFDLTEDFIKTIEEVGEVLPSDKAHIVRRVKKLVGNEIDHQELVEGLDTTTVGEIAVMESGFKESERKLRDEVAKVAINVAKIKQSVDHDKLEFRAGIESRLCELDKLVDAMLS